MSSLLKIDGMSVSFATPRGNLRAVNDVTIELLQGESLGVVGESGSGKTVLSRALRTTAKSFQNYRKTKFVNYGELAWP